LSAWWGTWGAGVASRDGDSAAPSSRWTVYSTLLVGTAGFSGGLTEIHFPAATRSIVPASKDRQKLAEARQSSSVRGWELSDE
jgi:hypothetical protein